MNKISRFSLVVSLVTVVTVTGYGQDIRVENGQLIVNTGNATNGIFVDGLDVTSLCGFTDPNVFTGPGNYCNSVAPSNLQFNLGEDGGLFETILGYSGDTPDGQNQWLFVSAASFSGVNVIEGVFADDANGVGGLAVESLVGMPWEITWSPDLDGQVFTGTVTLVPEPCSALLSLLGLAMFVVRRR